MTSNGLVGAVVIVLVGGLAAACTGQAVGDGKTGGHPFGLASGAEGTKSGEASSDGRTATDRTPTTSPSGPASSTGPSAPPSPSSKASCSAFDSGDTSCNSCAQTKCCDSIGVCLGNAQCANLNSCLNSCWDASCESSCQQQFQGGVALFQQASQCVRGSCSAVCF